jgi:hypothetical protein
MPTYFMPQCFNFLKDLQSLELFIKVYQYMVLALGNKDLDLVPFMINLNYR